LSRDSAQSIASSDPTHRTERSAAAHMLPWLVLAIWLTGTGYAFWTFEFAHQRPFESPGTVLFNSAERSQAAEAWFVSAIAPLTQSDPRATATVVHIYAPGCPCNRFTHPHLLRMLARYRSAHVNFVVAEPRESHEVADALPPDLRTVALPAGAEFAWIDATPAALIYNAAGKLVYFGPYSDSARCGESGGLVERVLDRVLRGELPVAQPFYAAGCFCNVNTGT
jgi:hypothetical protein